MFTNEWASAFAMGIIQQAKHHRDIDREALAAKSPQSFDLMAVQNTRTDPPLEHLLNGYVTVRGQGLRYFTLTKVPSTLDDDDDDDDANR
jgi:hypothetical protein